MNFAAALAKLEKTAHAASNSQHNRDVEGESRRRSRSEDRPDHQQRGFDSHGGRPHQRSRYDSQQGPYNSLDDLVRWGYRIQPHHVEGGRQPETSLAVKHLCLLMLCIDSVPYFDIWNSFANPENNDTNTIVSLVIHAKYPIPLSRCDDIKGHMLLYPPRIGRGNSYADPEYFTLAPNWGSLKLTEAMICLLRQGMEIGRDNDELDERFATRRFLLSKNTSALERMPPVDHFVFVSESCLPIRSLRECSDLIWGCNENSDESQAHTTASDEEGSRPVASADTADAVHAIPEEEVARTTSSSTLQSFQPRRSTKSWMCARNLSTPGVPRNKYESDQFRNINRMIPQACRWKADQWLLLGRKHAASVLEVDAHMRPADQLIHSFSKVSASDEVYFPTVLAVLGILREDGTTSDILMRQVTFVDWSEGMRNPASFERGIRDLCRIAKRAREQGCLFARKFVLRHPGRDEVTGEINAKEWLQLMKELQNENDAS